MGSSKLGRRTLLNSPTPSLFFVSNALYFFPFLFFQLAVPLLSLFGCNLLLPSAAGHFGVVGGGSLRGDDPRYCCWNRQTSAYGLGYPLAWQQPPPPKQIRPQPQQQQQYSQGVYYYPYPQLPQRPPQQQSYGTGYGQQSVAYGGGYYTAPSFVGKMSYGMSAGIPTTYAATASTGNPTNYWYRNNYYGYPSAQYYYPYYYYPTITTTKLRHWGRVGSKTAAKQKNQQQQQQQQHNQKQVLIATGKKVFVEKLLCPSPYSPQRAAPNISKNKGSISYALPCYIHRLGVVPQKHPAALVAADGEEGSRGRGGSGSKPSVPLPHSSLLLSQGGHTSKSLPPPSATPYKPLCHREKQQLAMAPGRSSPTKEAARVVSNEDKRGKLVCSFVGKSRRLFEKLWEIVIENDYRNGEFDDDDYGGDAGNIWSWRIWN